MLIKGICGIGKAAVVTPVVWVGLGVLPMVVTTHVGLGGFLNWGVPGIGGPGEPIAVVLIWFVVMIGICMAVLPCASLDTTLAHL